MPLPTPNLDNRDFEDLMDEVRALIPRYNPDWTNFNPSDPGIALFELFAWFTEQVQFRVNQVPQANFIAFLSLLGVELAPGESVQSGIQRAIALVSERYRAVTSEDYEELTLDHMNSLEPGLGARAIVVNNADLKNISPDAETFADVAREGNVSVIVVPRCDTAGQQVWCDMTQSSPTPSGALLIEVETLLRERRLITTRVHAASPVYRPVEMTSRIALKENTDASIVTADAESRIAAFIDPLSGGPDGTGWPAGRPIYRSEYFQILEGTTGVDHVEEAVLSVDGQVGNDIVVRPWELLTLAINTVTVAED